MERFYGFSCAPGSFLSLLLLLFYFSNENLFKKAVHGFQQKDLEMSVKRGFPLLRSLADIFAIVDSRKRGYYYY